MKKVGDYVQKITLFDMSERISIFTSMILKMIQETTLKLAFADANDHLIELCVAIVTKLVDDVQKHIDAQEK